MRSTVALNSVHRLLSCICLVLLFTSMVVATPAQEKPRLKDFGKSLKKDSRKNKEESPDSKKDKGESADVIRVQTDLVVCDVLVDFTQDKALLKKNLDSLRQKAASGSFGDSHQYSALMATLNEMFSKEDPRPIVIFQTDGDQLRTFKGGATLWTSFSFQDVRTTVEKSRATIYTIIPGRSLLDLTPDEKVERVLPLLPAGLTRQAMIS